MSALLYSINEYGLYQQKDEWMQHNGAVHVFVYAHRKTSMLLIHAARTLPALREWLKHGIE
jgi:hypothetical protein